MNISLIVPTRNNLPYLKLAYQLFRETEGNEHEIVILDDNSSDGTVYWMKQIKKEDKNLTLYFNTGPMVGHTVLYNIGVKMCKHEIFSIFHADMVPGPNYVQNILKHLKEKTVVSATRIEPPLHPAGKEKITNDFGIYPEQFEEENFKQFVLKKQIEHKDKTNNGIFAPWAMYKKDFESIGGHDPIFAPFPYEDSDIFQRFILAGYEIIQSLDSFVYHFTCRGHRWTEKVMQDSSDYRFFEHRARINYLRKWHSWVENDENMRPIVPKVYDTAFFIKNCNLETLGKIEPFASAVYCDLDRDLISKYIEQEQKRTLINLKSKIISLPRNFNFTEFDNIVYKKHDINVIFDKNNFTFDKAGTFLFNLSKIITDSGIVNELLEYDIFYIFINKLQTYEQDLIINTRQNGLFYSNTR